VRQELGLQNARLWRLSSRSGSKPRRASGGFIAIRVFALAATAFALVLAGCGASAKPHHAAPPQPSQADRMKAVVRAWTANLNAGNNAAEARLFSLPALISLMEGPYGCLCLTPAEVVQFHAQLLCSAKIVSIKVRRRRATAVFRLGDQETSKCDSTPGSLTAVRFTIVRGKITVWQQVWWRAPGGVAIRARLPSARLPGHR
jgi:hypothetical protein